MHMAVVLPFFHQILDQTGNLSMQDESFEAAYMELKKKYLEKYLSAGK